MLASPEVESPENSPSPPLSSADQAAINYYLIEAVMPDAAAQAAGISSQRFDEITGEIVPNLRGNRCGYNRFLMATNIVDGDRLRLDYEVRLGQLQRQHQMCIDAYRRTDDYAQHQLTIHFTQKDAEPLGPKSLTGDIRFLQLARAIRAEMDRLEEKLEVRIELLKGWQQRAASRPKPTAAPSAAEIASPPTPPQPASTVPSVTNVVNPIAKTVSANPKPVQTHVPAPSAAQRLPMATKSNGVISRDDLLAAIKADSIPQIQPAPRKPDKYSVAQRMPSADCNSP